MELGRECLDIWGYKRVDELIWVKTNQLQRLIRTGRTGHWLNHSKEHCLVGVKGNPNINRCIDCDVLVAEVGTYHQSTRHHFVHKMKKQCEDQLETGSVQPPILCGGAVCSPV